MDRLPFVFAGLLAQLKRPIPDVPVSAEPPTAGYSSNSLGAALGDPPSNVTPPTMMQQTHVVAQPPEDNSVMQSAASDVLPEAHIPQSRDPVPTPDSRTQAIGNMLDVSTQLSSSSGITLTNPPYPTTANQYTTTVPNDVARQHYKPMEYNQLALVPRRNFSNAVPDAMQWKVRQPQLPRWTPHYQPEGSTSTLPRQPPVKVRPPRGADRSRLAKDILKQLGKPSGSVPAVLMRHEYEEQKKTGAHTEVTSAQPPTEPAVAESQQLSNHDDLALPPEIVPVPDQVPSLGLSVNSPPATSTDEPPLLEYPDPDTGTTAQDVDATGEDVDMDTQPPEDPLVPQPPTSPRPDPSQELVPSPVILESALNKDERPAVNQPPVSEFPSLKRSGPPADAEVIEISDDEEPAAVDAVINTIESMEVDEEVGTGGAISQSLSELSLDRNGTLVAVETEKDRTKEPLGRRPSQEAIVHMQSTKRKLQKNRLCVEVPPLPDYVRQNKGKNRAPIQEEEEEGLYGVSVLWAWLLTQYSPPRPRTSSCRRPGIF